MHLRILLPVVVAVFLLAIAVSAFEPIFDARIEYQVGLNPLSVVAADFDGDGKSDLATSNRDSSVSILKNNGNGTFGSAVNYEIGRSATLYEIGCIVAADFDGDGKSDVAVANGDSSISILKNIGNGTFESAANYEVGRSATSFVAADFDGDGKPDLAVASWYSNSVTILQNSGNGTFVGAVNYGIGSSPNSVFAADFDGDGNSDLVTANWDSNSVSILSNNGNGTFAGVVNYVVGGSPISVISDDFDGDGMADLAVTYYDNYPSSYVAILKNNGNGTFASAINYNTGNDMYDVFASDFDGDGRLDLVLANTGANSCGNNFWILKNNGDGIFTGAGGGSTGTGSYSIVAADFNGDARPDVAVADAYSATVSVLINHGGGTFANQAFYAVYGSAHSVCAAALDGDGKYDLVSVSGYDPIVNVLRNNGDGTFGTVVTYEVGGNALSVCTADFDGDGRIDIATANSDSYSTSMLRNNGDGTFASAVNYGVGGNAYSVLAADLNGDGKPDLATANWDSNSVSILRNNGDGTFASAVNYGAGSSPHSIIAADFNGDGNKDLAVANGNSVSILLNHGSGTFASAVSYNAGSGVQSVTAADLNGDGIADLATVNSASSYYDPGTVSILENDGSSTFVISQIYQIGPYPKSICASDFDGDGRIDLVTANSSYYSSVSFLKNNGNGTFQNSVRYGTGMICRTGNSESVTATDVNGDGKPDLAVGNASYGNDYPSVLILMNQSAVVQTSNVSGYVFDFRTSQPMNGATAELWQNNSLKFSLMTSSNGFASQGTIPYGMYDLKVNVPGYFPFTRQLDVNSVNVQFNNILMYSTDYYASTELLRIAFDEFQSAFKAYFQNDCNIVRQTVSMHGDALKTSDYAKGAGMLLEVYSQTSPQSDIWIQIAQKNGLSSGTPASIAEYLGFLWLNTEVEVVKDDMKNFLKSSYGTLPDLLNWRGIEAHDPSQRVITANDILTELNAPIGDALPEYIDKNINFLELEHDLYSMAEYLTKYSSRPLFENLPVQSLVSRYSGMCDLGNAWSLPIGELRDNYHTFQNMNTDYLQSSDRRVLASSICLLPSSGQTLSSINYEISDGFNDGFFAISLGCQFGLFLSNVLIALEATDYACLALEYSGYWPQKLGELYNKYWQIRSKTIQFLTDPSVVGCSQSYTVISGPNLPTVCIPDENDYVDVSFTVEVRNDDTQKALPLRVEGTLSAVRTGWLAQKFASQTVDASFFSSDQYQVAPGATSIITVPLRVPNPKQFPFMSHYQIQPTLVSSKGTENLAIKRFDVQQESACVTVPQSFIESQLLYWGQFSNGYVATIPISLSSGAMCVSADMSYQGSVIDIHAYDDLGRHIGRNYATGAIDTTIPTGILIGDSSTVSSVTWQPEIGRTYHLEIVGVNIPDTEAVSVSLTQVLQISADPVVSPSIAVGAGEKKDTVRVRLNLYDRSGQNVIRIDSVTVSDLILANADTIPSSQIMIAHPNEVPADSVIQISLSVEPQSADSFGSYEGAIQITTDIGNISVPVQVTYNSGCCINSTGNVDGNINDAVNVVDITYLVRYLFQGGQPPLCMKEADVNNSSSINVIDITSLVNFLFRSGPALPACP